MTAAQPKSDKLFDDYAHYGIQQKDKHRSIESLYMKGQDTYVALPSRRKTDEIVKVSVTETTLVETGFKLRTICT